MTAHPSITEKLRNLLRKFNLASPGVVSPEDGRAATDTNGCIIINRKETYMFRNLINKLKSLREAHSPTKLAWEPCNFECYDSGGCENCAAWIEFEDEDYGTCGHWYHPGDELPDYIKRAFARERNERANEADDFTQLSFADELAHATELHAQAMELHKRLDAIERGE